MSLPSSGSDLPSFHVNERLLPALAMGWLFGCVLVFLVRWLGSLILSHPCEGKTILALAVPLLLGPGGLLLASLGWRTKRLGAIGVGLMISSLLPGLLVGAYDIGKLRSAGCAGGYIVLFDTDNEKSIESVAIQSGKTHQLLGRIGGFSAQRHPEVFQLTAKSNANLTIKIPSTARIGEVFSVTVNVPSDLPANQYQVGIEAKTQQQEKTFSATGNLNIQVLP